MVFSDEFSPSSATTRTDVHRIAGERFLRSVAFSPRIDLDGASAANLKHENLGCHRTAKLEEAENR